MLGVIHILARGERKDSKFYSNQTSTNKSETKITVRTTGSRTKSVSKRNYFQENLRTHGMQTVFLPVLVQFHISREKRKLVCLYYVRTNFKLSHGGNFFAS